MNINYVLGGLGLLWSAPFSNIIILKLRSMLVLDFHRHHVVAAWIATALAKVPFYGL